jgi:PAS domain S-box-containing protein
MEKTKPQKEKDRETIKRTTSEVIDEIAKAEGIINAIGDGLTILDRSLKVLYENQVHRTIMGDHIGEYCYSAYQKKRGVCDGCPVNLTFKDGKVHRVQRERQIDKETRYFEITASPFRDTDGKIIAGIEIVRDITERKRAQKETLQERDRAQNYLDIAGVILIVIDPEEKVRLINKKGCEVLGYKEEEIIGKDWFDTFIPDKDRERLREIFQKLIAGDIEPVEYFENPILTKSGDERLMAWHNTVLRDDTGKVISSSLSSGEDITERKKAEEALKEREKELQIKAHNLEEVNAALRVLLKRVDEDKIELEEKVLLNVKEMIVPYVEKLKMTELDERQKTYVGILESSLNQIISPFSLRMSSKFFNFTPKELQVANLLKQGKTNKEIGELLNSSPRTIACHRENIRKKLGLKNKKANLKSYLLSVK